VWILLQNGAADPVDGDMTASEVASSQARSRSRAIGLAIRKNLRNAFEGCKRRVVGTWAHSAMAARHKRIVGEVAKVREEAETEVSLVTSERASIRKQLAKANASLEKVGEGPHASAVMCIVAGAVARNLTMKMRMYNQAIATWKTNTTCEIMAAKSLGKVASQLDQATMNKAEKEREVNELQKKIEESSEEVATMQAQMKLMESKILMW